MSSMFPNLTGRFPLLAGLARRFAGLARLPRLTLLPGLALLPCLAPAASAADLTIELVRIEATGSPTGAGPEIDEAIRNLPAIAGLCRMYAKCRHDGTTTRELAWGERFVLGEGQTRIAVTAAKPGKDGKIPVSVRIGGAGKPCMDNSSAVAPGKPMVRFCERSLPNGTYIFVVTPTPS